MHQSESHLHGVMVTLFRSRTHQSLSRPYHTIRFSNNAHLPLRSSSPTHSHLRKLGLPELSSVTKHISSSNKTTALNVCSISYAAPNKVLD